MTQFAYMPDTHFGVYDQPIPDGEAVYAAHEQCILEAEAAEKAGFDAVWIPERHARTETFVPSPLPILSAIAARTTTIKIAPTVIQPTFYNPMMLAEQLAQIDQLSRGRLIFGAGVGYNKDHFDLFGVEMKRTGKRFEECMEVIDRAWREDRLTFHGQFFDYEDVMLTPKPYQRPRPPIWIGAFYDKAIERAIQWDGWCWWFPLALDEAQPKVDYWRERAREQRGNDDWTIAIAYEGWVGEDAKKTRDRHGPRWAREARFYVERGMSPDMGTDPLADLENRYLILGDPDYWIERLGEVIDRLKPDWINFRTRTPAIEDVEYPSLEESLENIQMLGERVVAKLR